MVIIYQRICISTKWRTLLECEYAMTRMYRSGIKTGIKSILCIIGKMCIRDRKISPIYWYDNEDVMMLYRIKGFKDDQYIQRHLIKGKSSNKEAQERGIVTGDMKYNFCLLYTSRCV